LANVTESSANLAEATDPLAKLVAFKFVKAEPLAAGSVAGNLASGTVPEVNCVAFKAVKAEPFAAGNVEGNLASGTVPEVNCVAFKAVKLLPLFATMFPLESSMTALDAGRVQKTSLVPEEKFTAESLLDDDRIVVLAKVPAPTVPRPTSNSPFSFTIV
jgi:hypothetical protein